MTADATVRTTVSESNDDFMRAGYDAAVAGSRAAPAASRAQAFTRDCTARYASAQSRLLLRRVSNRCSCAVAQRQLPLRKAGRIQKWKRDRALWRRIYSSSALSTLLGAGSISRDRSPSQMTPLR
jgi:hypothetical protein